MKISELITRLEKIKEERSDIEVIAWCRGDGGTFDFDVNYENGQAEVLLMDNTDYD